MLRIFKKYSELILSFRVIKFDQFDNFLRLRAEVEFIDSSKLYIRETVIYGEKRKYAYHWQDKHGELIIRWDNAPDWDVETFPHHKHIEKEGQIESSYERTLEQVLAIIARRVSSG